MEVGDEKSHVATSTTGSGQRITVQASTFGSSTGLLWIETLPQSYLPQIGILFPARPKQRLERLTSSVSPTDCHRWYQMFNPLRAKHVNL